MAAPKIDRKGRVRCWVGGRKKLWKRIVAKASRRIGKKESAA
jgi:hypothetical protein